MENAWETKWEYIVKMYEHRYKYGKQKAIMTDESFREKLEISPLKVEQKAYLVLLWHSGARKSEVYESKVKEVTYPYRTLVSGLSEAVEKLTCKRKKRFIESLPKISEVISTEREHNF